MTQQEKKKSRIFDYFVERGWITKEAWEEPIFAADVCPEVISRAVLEKLIERNYINFITSPKRWIKEFFRFITSKYRLNIIKDIPNAFRETLGKKKDQPDQKIEKH